MTDNRTNKTANVPAASAAAKAGNASGTPAAQKTRNVKIIVQYDGSRYRGWQRLSDCELTIQGKLEQLLLKLTGQNIEVIGSGRTDADVHSVGQTANFHIATELNDYELLKEINHYLPDDIAVTKLETVPELFHSRYNAVSKWYRYRVWNSRIPNVFERKYMYQFPHRLDISAMQKAAELMCGTHDFLPFSSLKKSRKSTVRTVSRIGISRSGDEIIFDFYGDGFLYNMIRIMTGTLLEVGIGERNPESISRIFEEGLRSDAGVLVPGKGLCLMEVSYKR